MEPAANEPDRIQSLGNAGVTGLALATMILVFGPVSGAHLNPLITAAGLARRELSSSVAVVFVLAQLAGAVLGVALANLMFGLPAISVSTTQRTGWNLLLSEAIATFGLVLVIRLVGARGNLTETAIAAGGFVGAAIVFTSSTCFANPAVTLARMFTDTATGIAPASVLPFLAAESIGALGAISFERLLNRRSAGGRARDAETTTVAGRG